MEEKIQKFQRPQIFIKGGEILERAGNFIYPNATDLRNWDANLFSKFKPKYYSYIQQCQYCAFGPCDLSKNRKGACGMRLNLHMSREALVLAIAGASSYIARANNLYDEILRRYTYFPELNLDKDDTILINLLCGYEPRAVGDLRKALGYLNEQIVHLISSTHMGQEASDFDFNSKALYTGTLSLLAAEIYEILRKFLNSKSLNNKERTFEVGLDATDKNKGTILIIGNPVSNIAQLINSNKDFEIVYIGSGGFEFSNNVKVMDDSKLYENLNNADIVIIGSSNVKLDVVENLKKTGIPVIAASDTNIAGFADVSALSVKNIVKKLMNREISGCYIKDGEKLSDVVKMLMSAKKVSDVVKMLVSANENKADEKSLNKKVSITLPDEISISEDNQILLVLGDANFPNGKDELIEILNGFLERNFLVFTAGDVAISIAESNLTHKNLINLGSLSASIHIIERIIRIASKGINKKPVGNFDEISNYIVNKMSVAALFWGATTQENFAYSSGLMRLGIPVIFGKQGIKYRREFRGDVVIDYIKDEYNSNYNEILKNISPKNFIFPHLCISANTKEEAMLLIPKLFFRNLDGEEIKAKKIENYREIIKNIVIKKTDDIKNKY